MAPPFSPLPAAQRPNDVRERREAQQDKGSDCVTEGPAHLITWPTTVKLWIININRDGDFFIYSFTYLKKNVFSAEEVHSDIMSSASD